MNPCNKFSSAKTQTLFLAFIFFLVFSNASLAETPLSYRSTTIREIGGRFFPEIPYCQEYKKNLLQRTLKKNEYEVSSDGWYIHVTNKSNWSYRYFRVFDGDGKQLDFKSSNLLEVPPNDVTSLSPDLTGFASKLGSVPSVESLKPKIFSVQAFGYDIRCAKKLPEQEIIALHKKDAESARLKRLESLNYDLCIVSLLPEIASSEIKKSYKRVCKRFSNLEFPRTKNKGNSLLRKEIFDNCLIQMIGLRVDEDFVQSTKGICRDLSENGYSDIKTQSQFTDLTLKGYDQLLKIRKVP